MALYEKLSSSSSPDEIAAAYKEFTGLAGGDTADVQKQAVDYLTGLGIAAPAITQAYDIYKAPPTGGLPTNDTVVDDGFVDTSSTSGNTGALTQASSNLTSAGALAQATSTASTAVSNPFDAINKAFIGGDYAGTAGIISGAGLTQNQIKDYYGFGDSTMDFLRSQGIFGTPTSTVASTLTTGADTTSTGNTGTDTSGLSVLNTTTGTDTKTFTQAEVDQALVDTLTATPNVSTADVLAAASTIGITADQVATAYSNLANTNTLGTETETGTEVGSETGTGTSISTWPSIIYGSTDEDGRPLTQTTTTDGTPFYLHDTNDGVYYQNPATVESYAPFTGADGKTYYAVYAPTFSSGLEWYQTPITSVLTEAQYRALQGGSTMGDALSNIVNSPVGSFGLNVLGPYGQIINAANAASKGNWTGAALSSLNAIGGFGFTDIADVPIGTAKNIAGLLNSYDKKDLAGMFTSGSNLLGGVPGSFTTAAQLASAGLALSNNDAAGFMKALGDLTGSKDAKVAASAISLKNAFESGNPYQLQAALSSFNSSVGNTGTSTSGSTKTTKVDDSVPLTAEEISDLSEDQLRVYQESGVSGLRDYNRAIKNLTSLTTSGYTGDSMGGGDTTTGVTTTGLTGNTRSLTGALSTATTTDQFEDLLITSLRSQGLNNAQISTYLENLNNQSTGLSDVGLLAFRQSKLSGATDAEALAAANLASGKTTAAVETDTGTEAELVVTDTNTDFETNIYSFYDTQSETETEIIVTSGLETGQPTELATETETETELVVTSGKETGQDTELSTESEILVTEKKETKLTRGLTTEAEITTEIVVTTASETQSETETESEIVVTTGSETESETETETETETESEIVVTTGSETESETETETETITEVIVTTSSETESETETETETISEIVVTTASETETESESESETETETETISEIVVTTSSETESETETITEILITDTVTESETETETETKTKIVTQPPPTKPPTLTSGSFTGGTPAQGGRGKPTDFLKENLLKTYMTKDSFKDPLAQFNKIRQDMAKDEMMQQGVDPRLAAILAAKMNGEEPPPAPTYNYGEEPQSIDDILGLKVEGERTYAQGGYVQPLMAQGGMALPLLAAKGGLPTMHKGREDFRDGKHVAGEGDGQSDDIPAMLADGEFVFPADVVSALGNGSTKAGTDKLYEMMHSIRDRARSKGRKDLPPPALKSPLDYLKKR